MQPGTYRGVVTSTDLAKTKSGKEQIAIRFQFENGESLSWYGFFTEAAFRMTEKALDALGWNPADNDYRFHELNGTTVLNGAEADCVVEVETTDDYGTQTRIRWVNRVGGGMVERMEEDEAARFAAEIRKKCIAWKGAGGGSRPSARPAQTRPAPQSSPEPNWDDPPF